MVLLHYLFKKFEMCIRDSLQRGDADQFAVAIEQRAARVAAVALRGGLNHAHVFRVAVARLDALAVQPGDCLLYTSWRA